MGATLRVGHARGSTVVMPIPTTTVNVVQYNNMYREGEVGPIHNTIIHIIRVRTLSFVFFLDDRFFGDRMLDLKLPFRGNLTIHDGGTIILLCLPETNTRTHKAVSKKVYSGIIIAWLAGRGIQ